MNVSRAGSFYPTTTVVFPEPFDSFFDNDAEWFSMAASQSFSAGPLAFGSDAQPSFGGAGELDDVELVANDAMIIDNIKSEPVQKDIKELPERFHDTPSIRNVAIAPVKKTSGARVEQTTLTFSSEEDDDESCAPRGKKRPRIEIDAPDPATVKNIKTIADKLTALDSETFQEYISRLESLRKLTSAEQNEIKKMKRRINNRESARKSRQEKRDFTDHLDEKIRLLTDQLHQTKLEMASLAAENMSLKNEIAFSYNLIAANPVLRQLYADLKEKHEAKRSSTSN